jgi:hypothetical protein
VLSSTPFSRETKTLYIILPEDSVPIGESKRGELAAIGEATRRFLRELQAAGRFTNCEELVDVHAVDDSRRESILLRVGNLTRVA